MTLAAGTKLGPYEILAPLGAGGMGEVYRARDTRLDRTVAIKVLPAHLAENPERRRRFEREARAVSALSHPHICTLYDIGHQDGTDFLVMEYLEGETLAQRLQKGALAPHQVLRIAIEIADALDKAHRRGVVHRDLKPANIMLTKAGAKVLDFGIAKTGAAILPDAAATLSTLGSPPAQSRSITAEGTLVGTLQYMAPEQLEGKEADARSDIFAFGAVLYEMATGKKAFEGKSQASVIAAILEREPPPVTTLAPMTPPPLDHLVRTCLAKDPDERYQTIHDVLLELRWIAEAVSQARVPTPSGRWWLSYSVPAMIAMLVLGFLLGSRMARKPASSVPSSPIHAVLPLPPDTRLAGWASPVVAFSPDGRAIAFVANRGEGVQQLYVRRLERLEAELVPDSEEAEGPFFSPDGQWVGFAVGVSGMSGLRGELKKFSLATGLTQTICEIPDYFGASWGEDGSIIFVGAEPEGLWRVSSGGGKPEHVVATFRMGGRETREMVHWPQLLPGGTSVVAIRGDVPGVGRIVTIDLATRDLKDLGIDSGQAIYSLTGHLLYVGADSTLMAAPFDPTRLVTTGPSVAALKEVCLSAGGAAVLAFSNTGALVYATGYLRDSGRELTSLVRIGLRGEVHPLAVEPSTFTWQPSVAPDGSRLAVAMWDGSLWIYDLVHITRMQLPTGKVFSRNSPVWTPDGKRIAFNGMMEGAPDINLFWQATDGSSEAEPLLIREGESIPASWTPDGQMLAFSYFGVSGAGWDMGLISTEARGEPKPLSRATEKARWPQISPDGRWLAYIGTERGTEAKKWNVFVRPFPGPGAAVSVSVGGGFRGRFPQPKWSHDGRELYYQNGDRFYAVRITTTPELKAGAPELLFEATGILGYDAAPGGQGFIGLRRVPSSGIQPQLQLVTNWFEELKRLAPVGPK